MRINLRLDAQSEQDLLFIKDLLTAKAEDWGTAAFFP